MSFDVIKADEVILEAELITKSAQSRLEVSEKWLHDRGYHHYSTVLANLRCKIEKAMMELVDDLDGK
jgi:hypothetical protein